MLLAQFNPMKCLNATYETVQNCDGFLIIILLILLRMEI